jgi:imidazolonepropionase
MDLLIKNIKQLVTVSTNSRPYKSGKEMGDLGIIQNATVLIKDGLFKWIGASTDFNQIADDDIDTIDASDMVALPGFVDSNTNLLFTDNNEDHSFSSIVRSTRGSSKKELKKHARRHIDNMMQYGTTTIDIRSGYGLNETDEIKMLDSINDLAKECLSDIIPTFFGAQAVPPEFKDNPDDYVDLLCKRMIPYIAQRKLAKYCSAICGRDHFSVEQCRRIFNTSKSNGIDVIMQADQSMLDNALELAAEIGAFSFANIEEIDEYGISLLKRSGAIATILPGLSINKIAGCVSVRNIIQSDIPLAIASNFNPVTCMSYSLPLMMTLACTRMCLTPEEAISAATINGAAALGLSGKLGSIEIGKQADIVLFDVPNYQYIVRHYGTNFAAKIIKRGIYLIY